MRRVAMILAMIGLAMSGPMPSIARGAEEQEAGPEESIARTPLRLSFVDGQVSFWRPGATGWAQAQVNTPVAQGDELYTGSPGNLELQFGSRAFVRAWANTQLGLTNQEPDFLQFKVTAGHASFDIRTLEPGRTVEVDTPGAAFTIEHTGYYRVDVAADRTSFISRRGGRATVTPPGGEAQAIAPSEEVVVEGGPSPHVASYVAPALDEWDKWNYARTDALIEAVSARYVSPGVSGVRDLDWYGSWRVVPTYGSVWVPTSVATGWAPYTTGSWVLDPYYGWTWVDTAPWGWAPYHYGRWVFVDGFWAWAPGPAVVRPVYAPALVAFFGGPGGSVRVTAGGPVVGWVALGWGEPIVPWWGPPGFVHVPWWGGWGGPRVVNNVVINRTTVVNVQNITVYRNVSVQHAVVTVSEQHFGRGPIAVGRVTQYDVKALQPIHGAPRVAAAPASFEPTSTRGVRPPEAVLTRSVVSTRPPHAGPAPAVKESGTTGHSAIGSPPPRLVSPPKHESALVSPRPPFGQGTAVRGAIDRPQPPAPPKFDTPRRPERSVDAPAPGAIRAPASPHAPALPSSPPPGRVGAAPGATPAPPSLGHAPPTPQPEPPRTAAPRPPTTTPRAEAPRQAGRQLPGEPANRLSPGRSTPPPRATGQMPQPAPRATGQMPQPPRGAPPGKSGPDRSAPGGPAGGGDRHQ